MTDTKEYKKALGNVVDFLENTGITDDCHCEEYLRVSAEHYDTYLKEEILALNKDIKKLEKSGKLKDLDREKALNIIEEYTQIDNFTDNINCYCFCRWSWEEFIVNWIFNKNEECKELYFNYIKGYKEIECKIMKDYINNDDDYYIDKEFRMIYNADYYY